MDKDKARARRAKNLKSFNDVLEQYELMKFRSSPLTTVSVENEGHESPNLAKPTKTDFCCDVELAVMTVLRTDENFKQFIDCFILGNDKFSTSLQYRYEQSIGQLFIKRSIWPVARYFKTLRTRIR